MAKSPVNLKQTLVKVTLVLLVLTVLAMTITPIAKSQTVPSIVLQPTSGPINEAVSITGTGFAPGSPVSVCFVSGDSALLLALDNGTDPHGDFTVTGNVPSNLSPGTYIISAVDSSGDSASATFSVTNGAVAPISSPTIPPIVSSTTAPSYTYAPTVTTPTVTSAGFFSPLAIAVIIVVVAIAVIIPTLMLRSRASGGKRETLLEKGPTPYRPEPYMPPPAQPTPGYNPQPSGYTPSISSRYSPSASSRYRRPAYGPSMTTPSATGRYMPPTSNVQQPAGSKICPNCKRVVRGDYSICPYCYKRLR